MYKPIYTTKNNIGEIMKKKSIIISLTVFLVTLIALVSIYAVCYSKVKSPNDNTPAKSKTTQYIVKEHDGKIAVFNNELKSPIYVLNSPLVRDLPNFDQKLLQDGIIADSNEKLLKILEDYDN